MKNNKKNQRKSTQSFLPIGEIKNDCVVLKEGGIRAVLKVSTINFNLKSEEEQLSTLSSYQQFLNTLNFPIQIAVQSRKVDLASYFRKIEERESEIENPLLKSQAHDYKEYIEKISEYADIMEKRFYVVVPSDPSRRAVKQNFLSQLFERLSPEDSLAKVKVRYLEFKSLRKTLADRVSLVEGGLVRCGLRATQLTNEELIDLYYRSYNPAISQFEKVGNVRNYTII
ncbi:TPA: hypothetical protein EYG96_02860 [Candidatus Gracilibacteria bacterium]|nr:hypothetical protein [Candidatus Peregrinibacteria bacterium]HIQ56954.1 hypothetical protein [Candidatus Gracilibacteria bacterium]HIQ57055.1 hypothetical protein [Candidatus Gracilibacteria bacterium]